MSTSKVTGTIAAISDYKEKDFFNLALDDADKDDNWYIGDGSLRQYGDFNKGDKIRIFVENGNVSDVQPVGKPQNNVKGSDESEGSTSSNESAPNGDKSDSTYIPPELQVAFKEACKDFRDLDEDLNMPEEREFKKEVTAMHYNILKEIGGGE